MSTLGMRGMEKVIGDLVCSDITVQTQSRLAAFTVSMRFWLMTFYTRDLVLSTGRVGAIVDAVPCSSNKGHA